MLRIKNSGERKENGHGGKGDASILGVGKVVSSNLTVRKG